MEKLVNEAYKLLAELNREESSHTRTVFFEALENNAHKDDALTYGMSFLYHLGCPLLILCRSGGGESFCWCIEYCDEIGWTINHFHEINGLEFLQIIEEEN